MSNTIVRNRRQRKKLYLEEFAILGFEFSCKINLDSDEQYESFFDSFADLIDERNLFVGIDGDDSTFEGFVSSGDRYGSATEEDRKAIEDALNAQEIISDVKVGKLVDAFYEA